MQLRYSIGPMYGGLIMKSKVVARGHGVSDLDMRRVSASSSVDESTLWTERVVMGHTSCRRAPKPGPRSQRRRGGVDLVKGRHPHFSDKIGGHLEGQSADDGTFGYVNREIFSRDRPQRRPSGRSGLRYAGETARTRRYSLGGKPPDVVMSRFAATPAYARGPRPHTQDGLMVGSPRVIDGGDRPDRTNETRHGSRDHCLEGAVRGPRSA